MDRRQCLSFLARTGCGAWAALFLAGAGLAGCSKSPHTGRNRLILLSEAQENELGDEAAREILHTEKISGDKAATRRVQEIGLDIGRATGEDGGGWQFHLIEGDDTVNAFALPGGNVFVYTGLLQLAETDGQLAAVLGHEAAHVILRHGAERMSQAQALELVGSAALIALGGSSSQTMRAFQVAFGIGANVGVVLPYSRVHEYEADRMGLIFMAKAGFDPHEALDFWRRMQEHEAASPKPPEFLSTHPAGDRRIEEMEQFLPEALKHYRPRPMPPPDLPVYDT